MFMTRSRSGGSICDEDEDDEDEEAEDGAIAFMWWSSCVCLRRVKRPRKRGRSVWK